MKDGAGIDLRADDERMAEKHAEHGVDVMAFGASKMSEGQLDDIYQHQKERMARLEAEDAQEDVFVAGDSNYEEVKHNGFTHIVPKEQVAHMRTSRTFQVLPLQAGEPYKARCKCGNVASAKRMVAKGKSIETGREWEEWHNFCETCDPGETEQ